MRHGSLFSGIGGFDLAAEWMGWENIFHCEWMEFPRKVLDYHFPDADSHIDICKTDFKKYANKIDILTGGFPCQPFSLAGKRKGTDDERYLWGEMLRAIQEIKPKFVIAENVFGITNIDGGLVFEQVCLDLETEGYEVQPFIIPASAKNAPHRRDRCWFIAYANGNDGRSTNRESGCQKSETNGEGQQSIHSRIGATSNEGNASDTNGNGFNERNGNDEVNTSQGGEYALGDINTSNGNGDVANTKNCGCRGRMCQECADGKRQLFQNQQGGSEMGCKIERCGGIGNATNTNRNGLDKQWRYDSRRQINARRNAPFKWSANTKNFDNGDTSANLSGQSTIDGRIGKKANVETNQLTTAKGICRMDKECDECKGIISNDRCENVNCGALVQSGHERIQSPKHRGMDKDCRDISSDGTNECENDGTIINRMDGDAANTKCVGLEHGNEAGNIRSQETKTRRERSELANDFETNGDVTNTTSSRGGKDNRIGKPRFNDQKSSPNNWENFPTQSPICSGDDGLPTQLDGIAFSKWRQESIKGYGNAIVPQIAYQLFQIINEL